MEQASARPRRRHDSELKKLVLAECAEPGASVAGVALKHGLNANLVHKWRRRSRPGGSAACAEVPAPQFVPLALPLPQPAPPREDIRIELRRGPTALTVTWPLAAAAECAGWMRELLR
jgi:transposase